tara:strand:- start:13637 stop:13975 length:339 start_codon:yes stop_codon:yes gene_type:complete
MKSRKNIINFRISIDQDTDHYDIDVNHNLSTTMTEEQFTFYADVIAGLNAKLRTELNSFAHMGSLLREVTILRDIIESNDTEIQFEPDKEFEEAVRNNDTAKILEFKTKKFH